MPQSALIGNSAIQNPWANYSYPSFTLLYTVFTVCLVIGQETTINFKNQRNLQISTLVFCQQITDYNNL